MSLVWTYEDADKSPASGAPTAGCLAIEPDIQSRIHRSIQVHESMSVARIRGASSRKGTRKITRERRADAPAVRTRCILGSLGSANYSEWNAGRCYQATEEKEREREKLRALRRLYMHKTHIYCRRHCLLTNASCRCIRVPNSPVSTDRENRSIYLINLRRSTLKPDSYEE